MLGKIIKLSAWGVTISVGKGKCSCNAYFQHKKLTTVDTWRECLGGGLKPACTIIFGGSEAFLDNIILSVNSFAGAKLCKMFHLKGTFIIIHGCNFSSAR